MRASLPRTTIRAVHAQPPDDAETVARWLEQIDAGDRRAVDGLFVLLYDELKRNAAAHLRHEAPGHTLSTTALAHEAWLRLADQTRTRWAFLGLASIMMRRILVNHAMARRAAKRDALLTSLTLTEAQQVAADASGDVLRVHEALLALEAADARAAKVVEMKFFGGLEIDEIAPLLGVSTATVKRDWTMARAWLHRELAVR
jgi:RNA polymerase sigma factor (TIGR02999 family)